MFNRAGAAGSAAGLDGRDGAGGGVWHHRPVAGQGEGELGEDVERGAGRDGKEVQWLR